jgi:hypothetical protein
MCNSQENIAENCLVENTRKKSLQICQTLSPVTIVNNKQKNTGKPTLIPLGLPGSAFC